MNVYDELWPGIKTIGGYIKESTNPDSRMNRDFSENLLNFQIMNLQYISESTDLYLSEALLDKIISGGKWLLDKAMQLIMTAVRAIVKCVGWLRDKILNYESKSKKIKRLEAELDTRKIEINMRDSEIASAIAKDEQNRSKLQKLESILKEAENKIEKFKIAIETKSKTNSTRKDYISDFLDNVSHHARYASDGAVELLAKLKTYTNIESPVECPAYISVLDDVYNRTDKIFNFDSGIGNLEITYVELMDKGVAETEKTINEMESLIQRLQSVKNKKINMVVDVAWTNRIGSGLKYASGIGAKNPERSLINRSTTSSSNMKNKMIKDNPKYYARDNEKIYNKFITTAGIFGKEFNLMASTSVKFLEQYALERNEALSLLEKLYMTIDDIRIVKDWHIDAADNLKKWDDEDDVVRGEPDRYGNRRAY